MNSPEARTLESATAAFVSFTPQGTMTPVNAGSVPDNKTRRYDRQLRLWAASGQNALESARVLVISGSATSTSILKNLVLPGIGHFTILDAEKVTPEDAGNNFFLHQSSIGKSRAEEAVKYLAELNDSVESVADTSTLANIILKDPTYLASFTLVIAHNMSTLDLVPLSTLLWENAHNKPNPSPPLIVIRSAGFLAEFAVQFHEHTIIDSHTEALPSLRIDKPFPDLETHALALEFENMDLTDHGHVPYVVILVRALHEWKQKHDGSPPKTYAEKKEFKSQLTNMKKKIDEENFDEAVAQAYRAWTATSVPREIEALFSDPACTNVTSESTPFFLLLHALSHYTRRTGLLPLSSTLPDMKSDTTSYIHLQNLYKTRAREELEDFAKVVSGVLDEVNAPQELRTTVEGLIDEFVRNAHGLKVMRGRRWGDDDDGALLAAIASYPAHVATHLALSALYSFEKSQGRYPTIGSADDLGAMTAWVRERLGKAGWVEEPDPEPQNAGIEVDAEDEEDEDAPEPEPTFWKRVQNALGEVARAPTSDLPTTAAFLGGLVAQEAIKLVTKQYVPLEGVCVVDLVASTTGVITV
ncbi:hypothetical protein BOTBODRAFT_488758 [Botryobasidium botryosum FD-172 SS1]|uniref:NEDD8-activating enzyme E1 regulatory subunit n=1 Tax=Botryobasidium botryosum (strain FD-172 SS1) TaxID=930990 RepID=A0A067MGL8_BOTB1|nr:hypothetical protein BOTBODRAFT_488758 [Botryobasidium botryosum FD-172 SS1]